MMFWLRLRKPLTGPTEQQEWCGRQWINGVIYPHIWKGFPFTAAMRCRNCHYRPYKMKDLEPIITPGHYEPYQWM